MDLQQHFLQWILNAPSLFAIEPPFTNLHSLKLAQLPPPQAYQGNTRLGFLYQHLCSELIRSSDQFDIVQEELQIQDEGKTLGAIDFILRDIPSSQYQHWEVAIKFYLLFDGLWYGPNAQDRLDKKLQHMLAHQLKMSTSNAFKRQFPQYPSCSEHLLMQGRMYVNPFLDEPIPQHCLGHKLNPETIDGYWCFAHQWSQIPEPLYSLEKSQWAVGQQEQLRLLEQPVGRFVHAQSQSGRFWFIVADDWPHHS